MFDEWLDGRTLCRFEPPRPVQVDMVAAMPGVGRLYSFASEGVSLHVRANGLRVKSVMAGGQDAWIRLMDGTWWAHVLVPAASSNGQSRVVLTLWVPARAVSPR